MPSAGSAPTAAPSAETGCATLFCSSSEDFIHLFSSVFVSARIAAARSAAVSPASPACSSAVMCGTTAAGAPRSFICTGMPRAAYHSATAEPNPPASAFSSKQTIRRPESEGEHLPVERRDAAAVDDLRIAAALHGARFKRAAHGARAAGEHDGAAPFPRALPRGSAQLACSLPKGAPPRSDNGGRQARSKCAHRRRAPQVLPRPWARRCVSSAWRAAPRGRISLDASWPSAPTNPARVDAEEHGQVLQAHVVQHLVERALEKGGVQADDGAHAALRHARSHRDGILLADADVEKAGGELCRKVRKPHAVRHGGGDADELFRPFPPPRIKSRASAAEKVCCVCTKFFPTPW